MNSFIKHIIISMVLNKDKRPGEPKKEYSKTEILKGARILKINIVRTLKNFILITTGIASATFGLKSFLLPSNFIDGGATGISLLISELTDIPISVLIALINIPFIILAYKGIGKQFASKTLMAIITLAISLAVFQFPEITRDKLLVSIFGGFFLGAGIGLSVRGGAVIDGTEVLAIYLSRKFGTTIGDIIIAINVFIFSAAAYFLSVETALYSLITYLAASKTLDFVVEGIDEYTGVTIISLYDEDIRQMIINTLGRGVTVYDGSSGYGKKGEQRAIKIIYTVITRLELNKLNTEIEKIDSNAFVVMSSVKDLKGGMIKKKSHKY
jgi:uncharacterized membrane-anchored protein YitT (DUF2179 family)